MINIELEGAAELQAVLKDIAKQYPKAVWDGCVKTAFVIEGQAKLMEINTTVSTGNLRASISTHPDKENQTVMVTAGGSAGTGTNTEDVCYAVYNEFGTRYIEPKLFMTHGAEIGFQQMAGLVIDEIEKIR